MLRKYAVGIVGYNKKCEFEVLATMDSYAAGIFIRDAYNEAYKRTGSNLEATLLEKDEVPKNHKFLD